MQTLNPNLPLTLTFIIYILGMLLVGYMGYRATKNFGDYILGGRRLGSFVTALAAGASDMSGWLLMGLPGAIYLTGLSEAWIAIGLLIGAYFNWLLVAGRLRIQTEYCQNALTLPDFFTHRFQDQSNILRIISAFVILVFFTIYCASGVVAGARLFENTFALPYSLSLWLGAAATILYVFIGGFLAVSWTDTIQASLMFFALLVTPIFVILAVGDLDNTIATIESVRPNASSLLHGTSLIGIISAAAWGLGYFGQPHILVRFMGASSVKTIPNARRIGMSWMFTCLLGSVAAGYFGIAYFADNPNLAQEVSDNEEVVFIALTQILFNPWIAGIILSAILAAVMSTLSAQLLVSASAITEDFYKAFFRPQASQKELVLIGRLMVLFIALIAIIIASNPDSRVLGLVSYAWGGFGAAFGPVILLSVMWKRLTRNGALAGMIVGATTVVIWKHFGFFNLYELLPGFIFGGTSAVLISLIDRPPSNTIIENFNRAERQYHQQLQNHQI